MVLYCVSISIDSSIYQPYLTWLKEHIQELLQLDGFINALILKKEGPNLELEVHYQVETREKLEKYFNTQALNLRKAYPLEFEGKFTISRNIYEEIFSINSKIN